MSFFVCDNETCYYDGQEALVYGGHPHGLTAASGKKVIALWQLFSTWSGRAVEAKGCVNGSAYGESKCKYFGTDQYNA